MCHVAGDGAESGQEPLAADVAINDFESSQDLLLGLGGEEGQVGTSVCEGHTIMRKPCGATPSSIGVMKRPAAVLVGLPVPDLKNVKKKRMPERRTAAWPTNTRCIRGLVSPACPGGCLLYTSPSPRD